MAALTASSPSPPKPQETSHWPPAPKGKSNSYNWECTKLPLSEEMREIPLQLGRIVAADGDKSYVTADDSGDGDDTTDDGTGGELPLWAHEPHTRPDSLAFIQCQLDAAAQGSSSSRPMSGGRARRRKIIMGTNAYVLIEKGRHDDWQSACPSWGEPLPPTTGASSSVQPRSRSRPHGGLESGGRESGGRDACDWNRVPAACTHEELLMFGFTTRMLTLVFDDGRVSVAAWWKSHHRRSRAQLGDDAKPVHLHAPGKLSSRSRSHKTTKAGRSEGKTRDIDNSTPFSPAEQDEKEEEEEHGLFVTVVTRAKIADLLRERMSAFSGVEYRIADLITACIL